MCGRFSLGTTDLKTEYGLKESVKIRPHYNVAPSQTIPVIVNENGQNVVKMMRWGFQWKDQDERVHQVINAKGETLTEKRMFSKAVRERRCLIPATGFYEWQKTSQGKIPHYIYVKDKKLFSFGGLWRVEKDDNGEEILTCVIITTEPNSMMQSIHNRMPLILSKQDEKAWLEPSKEDVTELVQPFPAQEMTSHTVSKTVNSPSNDGEALTEEFSYELKS